jgi:hypothetical protein
LIECRTIYKESWSSSRLAKTLYTKTNRTTSIRKFLRLYEYEIKFQRICKTRKKKKIEAPFFLVRYKVRV